MKDRIVFFVLGAILATIAYFVGDMSNNISAQNEGDFARFDDVIVSDTLWVHGKIVVQHVLPDNKTNLLIIAADEDGTQIRQEYMYDPRKGHPSVTSSQWRVANKTTLLQLESTGTAGIKLQDSTGLKVIAPGVP